MKRFGELGIKQQDDRKIFNCPQVSVTDILNSEIEVIDFLPDVKTKHGEGRYLVEYIQDGSEGKFFTNSSALKSVLEQIPKTEFPFVTTIRCIKCGNGKIYQFT
jgi:hypothetical protein